MLASSAPQIAILRHHDDLHALAACKTLVEDHGALCHIVETDRIKLTPQGLIFLEIRKASITSPKGSPACSCTAR